MSGRGWAKRDRCINHRKSDIFHDDVCSSVRNKNVGVVTALLTPQTIKFIFVT